MTIWNKIWFYEATLAGMVVETTRDVINTTRAAIPKTGKRKHMRKWG